MARQYVVPVQLTETVLHTAVCNSPCCSTASCSHPFLRTPSCLLLWGRGFCKQFCARSLGKLCFPPTSSWLARGEKKKREKKMQRWSCSVTWWHLKALPELGCQLQGASRRGTEMMCSFSAWCRKALTCLPFLLFVATWNALK